MIFVFTVNIASALSLYWLVSGLVVGEVALSLVLLAGAGLLMRTFVNLTTVNLGFDPAHVLSARVPLPRGRYDTREARQHLVRR